MKDILSILAWAGVFLAPIQPVMFAALALVVLDFVSAVSVSVWLNGWKSFKSARIKDTLLKLTLYEIGLIIAYVCQTWMFPQIPFIKLVTGFLAMTEFRSFSENLAKVTGGSSIYRWITNYLKTKLKTAAEAVDEPTNGEKQDVSDSDR